MGVGDRTGPQRGEGRGPTGRSGWQLGLEPRSVALRLASSWLKSGPIPTEGPWPSLAAPTGSPGRTGPGGGGRKVRGGGRASQTGGFGKPGGGAGAAAWPAGDPVAQLRGGEPRRELVASRNGVTPPRLRAGGYPRLSQAGPAPHSRNNRPGAARSAAEARPLRVSARLRRGPALPPPRVGVRRSPRAARGRGSDPDGPARGGAGSWRGRRGS